MEIHFKSLIKSNAQYTKCRQQKEKTFLILRFLIAHSSIGDVKTLPLKKSLSASGWTNDSKRGRNDSLSRAAIRILQCVPEEQFSLVDYIKGGCKIKFSAAIDFSSSNADDEDTLHSTSDQEVSKAVFAFFQEVKFCNK